MANASEKSPESSKRSSAHVESRFAIGIDLGTTNCALAYVDRLQGAQAGSQILAVPQLEFLHAVGSHATLPSFLYLPTEAEALLLEGSSGAQTLSHETTVVAGLHARNRAREVPGRVVLSAKSWLAGASHEVGEGSGIDAEQPILPWGSRDVANEQKVSPIEASAAYLRHLKQAWNSQFASIEDSYRLEEQEVVVTVPASFDEIAQQLTLEAAKRAGLGDRVRLLEEPQAAFYRYLEQSSPALAELLEREPSIRLLVCDMGGGTTDFSLFDVARGGAIERVAVSEHLLLGGDNIDLAVARAFEVKLFAEQGEDLPGRRLSPGQWGFLVQAARNLKEEIFSQTHAHAPDQTFRIAVPPEGSNLFAAALSAELRFGEISELVLRGFFPDCDEYAVPLKRRQGLRELGLPYAVDTAVTRHLASFLSAQGHDSRKAIDAVLFVGGSFTPERFRFSILENLAAWQERPAVELPQTEYDLGVARGAAVFASLEREDRRRIRAGYAHSVYLEVQQAKGSDRQKTLLCVLPQGAETGSRYAIALPGLRVVLGQAVQFQPFTCLTRGEDSAGDIASWQQERFHRLAPLQTTVELTRADAREAERGEKVSVELVSEIDELGMLKVYLYPAENSESRYELKFNLRAGASGGDVEVVEETPNIDEAAASQLIDRYFGKKVASDRGDEKINPANLTRELEELLGASRDQWTLAQLRALWKPLGSGMSRRSRSLAHELAWLSLAGYLLRPGYGAPLDAVRMSEAWKAFDQGLFFPKETRAKVQWWIMWRRVAGGLSADQHERIYKSIQSTLQPKSFESSENILLAGSLERIALERKRELGSILVKRLRESKTGLENPLWALSRIGARVLLSAGPEFVLAPGDVEKWIKALLSIDWKPQHFERVGNCFVQLARLTGERALDVSAELRPPIIQWLRANRLPEYMTVPLREVVEVSTDERRVRFGEALPAGLELSRVSGS